MVKKEEEPVSYGSSIASSTQLALKFTVGKVLDSLSVCMVCCYFLQTGLCGLVNREGRRGEAQTAS